MELKVINNKGKRSIRNRLGFGCNKRINRNWCSVLPVLGPKIKGKKNDLNQALGFCEQVMKATTSEQYYTFLELLGDYAKWKIAIVDLKIKMAGNFPSFIDDFQRLLKFYDNHGKKKKEEEEEEEEEEGLTTSYVYLPEGVRGVHNQEATELEKEVINTLCACKGSDKDWPSRSLSPAEEMLFQREEELFISDMLESWMVSTRENATKLSNAIRNGEFDPTNMDVNSYFTAYDFRFIDKMYRPKGLLMVAQLRREPHTVLPVIIERLNAQQDEE